MNRRFVASLMFVAAGLLAVPATAHAVTPPTSENCEESNMGGADPGCSAVAGSVAARPTAVSDECDEPTHEQPFAAVGGSSDFSVDKLIKSFSGGFAMDSHVG